jgi:ubiquinone/menaquinone biosynthesis C-methylase UbiE
VSVPDFPPNILAPDYFDGLADSYDADFSERLGGRWLRGLVNDGTRVFVKPGFRVLEIGCGTGEDAIHHAGRGCEVVATDACEKLLAHARKKAAAASHSERITFFNWDANEELPAELVSLPAFDVVFSNFGALNCVRIDAAFAARLAGLLKPGGSLVAVVMGPVCIWEIIWFGVRGQANSAFRRLRGVKAGDWQPGVVCYPAHPTLAGLLAPSFELLAHRGIGVFLPPTFAFHLIDRWPGFFSLLKWLEQRVAGLWPFTRVGDHYLAVFRKGSLI